MIHMSGPDFSGELPQLHELEGGEVNATTLQAIDTKLFDLMAYVPHVHYTREVGYVDEGSGNAVELFTTEKMNDDHDRGIRIALPYTVADGTSTHGMVNIYKRMGDGVYSAYFTDHDKISPHDLLHSPLIPRDLPGGVRALLSTLSQRASGDDPFQDLPEGDEGFEHLWRDITNDLDEAEIPRGYNYFHSAELNGKRVHVSTRNVMPKDDGTVYPEDTLSYVTKSISLEDDFSFEYTRLQGETNMYFIDETLVTDDKLPPLTEADRKKHPYVVVPASFGSDTGENTLPYRVIRADVGDGMTRTSTVWFETPKEGQAFADKLYQRDLADAKVSHEVTEARAQHALTTLHLIVENAQGKELGQDKS